MSSEVRAVKVKRVFLLTKIIIIMKNEFYFIDDLKVNIRMSEIISFQKCLNHKNEFKPVLQCLIVLKPNSVYWCDVKHYDILDNIFNIKN